MYVRTECNKQNGNYCCTKVGVNGVRSCDRYHHTNANDIALNSKVDDPVRKTRKKLNKTKKKSKGEHGDVTPQAINIGCKQSLRFDRCSRLG